MNINKYFYENYTKSHYQNCSIYNQSCDTPRCYNNEQAKPTQAGTAKKTQEVTRKEFLKKVFETLHPGKKMVSNWHLDLLVEYLQAVENGDVKRLIVNLPPRSLKSICINVAWPAWLLGQDPSIKIITTSYSQTLSEKHSTDCRLVLQSDWYQDMFPGTKIAKGMNTKCKFTTTQQGFRFATSTCGTLTGEGADIIIVDDPCSAIDIFSRKKRSKIYEWFKQCLLSRLNDHENGKIIIVMQRLHVDDLTGLILKDDVDQNWRHLKISAIAPKNQYISFRKFSYERLAGEQLYDNAEILYDGIDIKQDIDENKSAYCRIWEATNEEISHGLNHPFRSYLAKDLDFKNNFALYCTAYFPSIQGQILTNSEIVEFLHKNNTIYRHEWYVSPKLHYIDINNFYKSKITIFAQNSILESLQKNFPNNNLIYQLILNYQFFDTNDIKIYSSIIYGIFEFYSDKQNNIYSQCIHFAKQFIYHNREKKLSFHKEIQKHQRNIIKGININFNKIKKEIGTTTFDIQYQQEPNITQHTVIKEDWLQYEDFAVIKLPHIDVMKDLHTANESITTLQQDIISKTTTFDYIYQSWDCAIKSGEKNDYSVCTSWGIKDDKFYLLHVLREKLDYPELRVIVLIMLRLFQPHATLVEDCAAGQQIVQEMLKNRISAGIFPIKPQHNKITRLTLVSPVFERKAVVLPKYTSWKECFVEEIVHFPNTEHDDQVDSTSQFLSWYQRNITEIPQENVFEIRYIK